MPDGRRTGVLLMAYGTPRNKAEIEPYYTDIRRGRKPSAAQLSELTERYDRVGGSTPLLEISKRQADGVQQRLGPTFQTFLGMKHWHPYIRDTVAEMKDAGISEAIGLVLAPHYSRGSVGEYQERVNTAVADLRYDLSFSMIPSWHLADGYLAGVEKHVAAALEDFRRPEDVTIIFTAHSLPKRVVSEGDPYLDQLIETSRAVAKRLDLSEDRWTFSFQSAGRTPDPWLGPDILETVDRLAAEKVRGILVAPIGFIADHLEIFYDIDVEAKARGRERGVRLERMQSLNDDPLLLQAIVNTVRSNVSNRLG